MTVHITLIAATARFWDDDAAVYGTRYDASLVLQWESKAAVILSAFTLNAGAHVTRKLLRELVAELAKFGIERIRSTREQGRLLPFGKLQPDGTFLHSVAELTEYCAQEDRRRPAGKPPAPAQHRRHGEKDWQPTVPSALSHQLENHVRATDPGDVLLQRSGDAEPTAPPDTTKPEPAAGT